MYKRTRVRSALMACLVFFAAISLHAQAKPQNCPWLNKATAAGALNGEVSMNVTRPTMRKPELPNGAPDDATCDFTLLHGASGASGSMLKIAVHTMANRTADFPAFTAECDPSPRHVVGVGNEAIACTRKKGVLATEQIVARVRQRAFVLTLSMPAPAGPDSAAETQLLRDKVQNLAEQVAGSLF